MAHFLNTRFVASQAGLALKEFRFMVNPPDLPQYRRYFPSLDLIIDGRKAIFFDNPGGT